MDGQESAHELSSPTRQLLNEAAAAFGAEGLKAALVGAPNNFSFSDLDKATQVAIDSITKAIAANQPEPIVSYCGSVLVTGYLVGRAMLRTAGGALHFSNPLTEADHADTLIRLSITDEAIRLPEGIRPMSDLLVVFEIERANQAGPVSPLPEQERLGLAGGSAVAGLTLAIAEHDLFAAERASEERAEERAADELPKVSPEEMMRWQFVMAVSSTHAALGLGDDFPIEAGVRVLLLLKSYHQSGLLESDAALLGLVQDLNDLSQPHRKALGFGLLNKWPDKARTYVRRLLLEGVESEALSMSLDEAKGIADRI